MKLGIVGAGTIGADLAYFFAGALAKSGGAVMLLDIDQERLIAAMGRVRGYAEKGVAKGKLSPQAAKKLLEAITTTGAMAHLAECDTVIEAASENLDVKRQIHARLEKTVCNDCVICTTTSSIPRHVLAAEMKHPERFFVFHPFTPAARSPVVEFVGDPTSPYYPKVYDFIVASGKVPLVVKDTPCFAGNDIFIAYCAECARLVEKGIATVAQVNAVADKYIGGSGGFNVLNITRANAIADFCCRMMRAEHGDWWITPKLLVEQGDKPWDLSGDKSCDEATESKIRDALMAVVISRAIRLVDNKVISATDLDWLCENALGFKFGPVAYFNQNPTSVKILCAEYAHDNPAFKIPDSILKAISVDFFSNIKVEIGSDGIAVVTVFRPGAMNALNRETMAELDAAFRELEDDRRVRGVIFTGFNGAIAGADITELAALTSPEQGVELAADGQSVLNYIADFPKPVVGVVNGPCLGGGCELMMACHARVVGKNAIIGQPEVNLGIIPGYGGTQRLPRLVGFAKALELLRTGRTIDAGTAKEIGWAINLGSDDALGSAKLFIKAHLNEPHPEIHPINPNQMEVPDGTPIVDIGNHSLAIDAILVRVVREGLAKSMDAGLQLEADGFGDCFKTQDMRIGLLNFMNNGPKVPAVFVNA